MKPKLKLTEAEILTRARTEIHACKRDFDKFAKYLKIFDRATEQLVSLKLNPPQQRLHAACGIARGVQVMKSRQLGSSTYFLARAFWRAWRQPAHNVLVVGHLHDAVQAMFRVVRRFYEHLPAAMGGGEHAGSNTELTLPNGSVFRVASSQSSSMRGLTYSTVLLTEYAFYANPEELVASAIQTLTPTGEIYLESTANGLNWAYQQWFEEPSPYQKVFLSWRMDPTARAKSLMVGAVITPDLMDMAQDEGWSDEELNWAANQLSFVCKGNWRKFCQEQPSSAAMAFQTTGSRVFGSLRFPVQTNVPDGYMEFQPPDQYNPVACGVDVASGSPTGDYSAFTITDRANNLYATYRGRIQIPDFHDLLLPVLRRYGALCAVEVTGVGVSLHQMLVKSGYYHHYRRHREDASIGQDLTNKLGWTTTDSTRPILINCLTQDLPRLNGLAAEPRLQQEIGTFEYDNKGRAGHNSKGHDDLMFSYAMSRAVVDQIPAIETHAAMRRPRTTEEIASWQKATQTVYSDALDFDDDDSRPQFDGLGVLR